MALRRALAANASSSAMAMCVSQLLAILKPVAARNSSLQTDEAIKDALIQELTGTEACASAFAAPSVSLNHCEGWGHRSITMCTC